jgi:hypothetical protein
MIGRQRSRELERIRVAETRTGCPLELVLAFTMFAQDRVINRREERWSGEIAMWLALDPQHVWILHGRHRPTAPRNPQIRWALRSAPEIGSVWDKLPRRGLTAHSRARPGFHDLELSWPRELRLITGRLHGPRGQRDRAVGQLAADELRTAFTEGFH